MQLGVFSIREAPCVTFSSIPDEIQKKILGESDIGGLACSVSRQFRAWASSKIIRASTLTSVEQVEWAMKMMIERDGTCDITRLLTTKEVFQWAVGKGMSVDPNTFEYTIKYGRLDTLEYAFDMYRSRFLEDECVHSMFMTCAARHGQNHILEWALQHGFQWTCHCTEAASEHGHLHTLMWAYSKSLRMGDATDLVDAASRGGHINILEMFLQSLPSYNREIFEWSLSKSAALHGRKDVLMWMREKGFSYNPRIMYFGAMSKNYVDMMSWLLSQGCEWYPEFLTVLQQQEADQAVIDWALEHGCPQ